MEAQEVKTLTEEATASGDDVGKLLGIESGFKKRRYSQETVDAFVSTLNEAADGSNKARYILQEAMVSADFPYLFGDVLDRSLMAQWGAQIPNWEAFVKTGTVRDFREAKRYGIEGMGAVLDAVGERAEYPERGPTEETPITVSVDKYGARFGVSFETLINDDLNALRDMPQRLVLAARRTEALAVTNLYAGTAGPDGTLYTAGHKNIVDADYGALTDNPALSVHALGIAMGQMNTAQLDVDGFPLMIDAYVLVVPPALETTALNILNATQIEAVGMFGADGASGNDATHIATYASNWLNGKLTLVVDPFLPLVCNTNATTSWWLFASKSAARPALEVTRLAGHEAPELFVKAPNANRIGGGSVAESFENDEVEYKVRHIFGSTTIDYRATIASNGSGS